MMKLLIFVLGKRPGYEEYLVLALNSKISKPANRKMNSNISPELIYAITKRNACYTKKFKGRNSRVLFSSNPANLYNIHSPIYASSPFVVKRGSKKNQVVFSVTKDGKRLSATNIKSVRGMEKNNAYVEKLSTTGDGAIRQDLLPAVLARYTKVAQSVARAN
eukprot:maker-scaffold_15-snap-gene-2.32-mRNA-1 protein AED:0.00 eAED:0.00 QI:9/1/1/1/0/0/2/20/161